ncbi:MAG: helix-turn-helix domain-containing protein [Bacteroidota bacterium]|nr:helix-turn-helix domain-containing protein [Bacteroidota bacterium]MDP4272895.1 helix-turn-helix domain-containing protein [Bacteroidota bacterium]
MPEAEQEQIVNSNSCGVLPDNLLYIIGAGSTFFYICLSIRFLKNSLKEKADKLTSRSLRQIQFYAWILYFFLSLIICYGILTLISPSTFEIHDAILALLVCVSFIYIFIIFYIKPSNLQFKKENSGNFITEEEKKEQLEAILNKLNKIIKENRSFLKTDFDINALIVATQIPGYKISNCIHEQFNISVPEYINRFRVSYAKKCLTDDNMSSVKMDFLAQECGFSSRSNFYSTFKRHTGFTPLEYKKMYSDKNVSDN